MGEIICKHMTEDILRTLKSSPCYMELIPKRKTQEGENNLKSRNLISLSKEKHFSEERLTAPTLGRAQVYSVCLVLSLEV